MSDLKLRELKRVWASGDASPNETVAYLAALRQAGRVTENECRLAWRIHRLEALSVSAPGTRAPQDTFDHENADHAHSVLTILVSQAPELGGPHGTCFLSPMPAEDELMTRAEIEGMISAHVATGRRATPRERRPGIDGPP